MNAKTQLYTFEIQVDSEGNVNGLPTDKMKELFKMFAGKKLNVTFEKQSKKRSIKQLGYYWGCIIPHFRALYYEFMGEIRPKERINNELKLAYGAKPMVNPITGHPFMIGGNPVMIFSHEGNLSTEEQEEFHEFCRQTFYEISFGESIPLPSLDWRNESPLCFTKDTLEMMRRG